MLITVGIARVGHQITDRSCSFSAAANYEAVHDAGVLRRATLYEAERIH